MKSLIAVIGAGQCNDSIKDTAYRVGQTIAQKGFGIVCGGLGGVMQAASEGCKNAGGITVGIIPQDYPEAANPYIDIVIPTGIGIMRNLLVIRTGKAVIAVNGKYGTLSEIAFALQLEKPIVGVGSWEISPDLRQYEDPVKAVHQLISMI